MKLLTLHTPQATVHSSLVADAWFAWHSIHRSIIWFRQMAQLSTTMSETKKQSTVTNRGILFHHLSFTHSRTLSLTIYFVMPNYKCTCVIE